MLERVRHVWREVPGTDDVRPHSDFFDLGGNSVAALKVRRLLGGGVPLTELFRHRTAAALAAYLADGARPSTDHLLFRRADGAPPRPRTRRRPPPRPRTGPPPPGDQAGGRLAGLDPVVVTAHLAPARLRRGPGGQVRAVRRRRWRSRPWWTAAACSKR
ncbi:acyl carrier protein [Streptomyces sp. NPDC014983]|uniref:acyl carrier protein n=1 Tax=Streptomyces sp. NPDC014983 TaxID=3364933 RepID=UPI0036F89E96